MYYQVSKEFFDKLPNACFGAVAVRGLNNTHCKICRTSLIYYGKTRKVFIRFNRMN